MDKLNNQKVTVMGLGPMGTALAMTLVQSGTEVTVWNRTKEKANHLIHQGASRAETVADAIQASPTIIINVSDYHVTKQLLCNADIAPLLFGKTIIQLSTGSPKQAKDLQVWMEEQNADYLDGAIMAWPEQIGAKDGTIIIAGSRSGYETSVNLLYQLVEYVIDLGENVAAASALDQALQSYFLSSVIGFVHGMRICEAEGLSLENYRAMLSGSIQMLGNQLDGIAATVTASSFTETLASLSTYTGAVNRLVEQATDAEINVEFPVFLQRIFQRAVKKGYGNQDIASLIKIFRERESSTPVLN